MSYRTLCRRLKSYGLYRRGFNERDNSEDILEVVRQRISEIINGAGSCGGYRTVWHTLKMEGLQVPRIVVQETLKELDPEGTERRKAHRLKRRQYHMLARIIHRTWMGMISLNHLAFPSTVPLMDSAEKSCGLT